MGTLACPCVGTWKGFSHCYWADDDMTSSPIYLGCWFSFCFSPRPLDCILRSKWRGHKCRRWSSTIFNVADWLFNSMCHRFIANEGYKYFHPHCHRIIKDAYNSSHIFICSFWIYCPLSTLVNLGAIPFELYIICWLCCQIY